MAMVKWALFNKKWFGLTHLISSACVRANCNRHPAEKIKEAGGDLPAGAVSPSSPPATIVSRTGLATPLRCRSKV